MNTAINYGNLCLLIALLYGLVPLIDAAKPKTQQSLMQPKNKGQLKTTPAPEPQQTSTYNKEILHESLKSINEAEAAAAADPFRLLSDWKQDSSSYLPWNSLGRAQKSPLPFPYNFPIPIFEPYSTLLTAMSQTSKMFNFFAYPQPIFIPYPVGLTPEMLYENFVENNPISEDNMSRARQPTNSSPNFQRNSPIYYVRLPPTPYMFLPSFNYPSKTSSINPYMPFPSISNFHALPMSSVFNLPMHFLANGKPNGIYRIDDSSSNNLPHDRFPYTESQHNSFRPITSPPSPHLPPPSSLNLLPKPHSQPFAVRPPTTPPLQPETSESQLGSFKRPYVFNGRPEDIYILPNSIYSEGNFY